MNQDKSRTTEVAEGVAFLVGIVIAVSALLISAYRQYVLVLRTLPQNSDLLVQALPFLAPFCVEGFIVYAFIRLRYTRPKKGEMVAITVYGILMIIAAIVSNIIESNISMGITLTDQSLATFLQAVVPSIPVATGLVMMAMHLLAVQETAAGVKADHDEKYDKDYQAALNTELAQRRKTAAHAQAAADANAILEGRTGAPLAIPAAAQSSPDKQTSIVGGLRAMITGQNGHAEPDPNAGSQRKS